MLWFIGLFSLLWLVYLLRESNQVRRSRETFSHVIHVNGTRGKSTVCRLIEAGLRQGNMCVFCKTTGTNPMTIDVYGAEEPIIRRGKANIKEQIGIMRQAAAQGAQVLVVECMALQPELQWTAQHRILRADIGVITNVRMDHMDVMGDTLPQIAQALSNSIPRRGVLFTAEDECWEELRHSGEKLDSQVHQIRPDGSEPDFDFAENIALALAVCTHLGVDRAVALEGMSHFQRDPFALSLHRWGDSIFVNGLSINDVQSTCMVWESLSGRHQWEGSDRVLLVNNRADRGSRTQDMVSVCVALQPQQIWLLGASQGYMAGKLSRLLPGVKVVHLRQAEDISRDMLAKHQIIFAIGNIAHGGRDLMERVREEGTPFVS